MPEYTGIFVNMLKSAWMAFVLHFPIAIVCLNEYEDVFLKRRNLIFSIVAWSIWFAFCFRLNNFKNMISNLLPLGVEGCGSREPWILICLLKLISIKYLTGANDIDNVSRSCTIFAKESIEKTSAWRTSTRTTVLLLGTIKSVFRNQKFFQKLIFKIYTEIWHIRQKSIFLERVDGCLDFANFVC